jgi:hypothetical protein
MGHDGVHLGIGKLGEGRHDPPRPAQPDGAAQIFVVHRGLEGRQGQGDTDAAPAIFAMAGGAMTGIELGAIRRPEGRRGKDGKEEQNERARQARHASLISG